MMEYTKLRSYGQINIAKPSARVMMACVTTVPKELGFIGTPKFLKRLATKERHWGKKRFKSAEERGVVHAEFIQGVKFVLAFYSALIATCGREKAKDIYPRLTEKMGVMMWEEFLPTAEDFKACPDTGEAVREVWAGYVRADERENMMRVEVVQDTATDFQVTVTDCPWDFMLREGGYPELSPMNAESDCIVLPRLMSELGGDFKREACLCAGDPTCDWHFLRYNSSHQPPGARHKASGERQ
jgi:hypothetical protein